MGGVLGPMAPVTGGSGGGRPAAGDELLGAEGLEEVGHCKAHGDGHQQLLVRPPERRQGGGRETGQ